MQIFNYIRGRRAGARGLLFYYCLVLLTLLDHRAALAQQQAPRFESTGLDKPAQDITLSGTVAQLSTQKATGFLLTMNGPHGTVTACLGSHLSPNLTDDLQQALTSGSLVQLTGVMQTSSGESYLLARTLTVGSQQIALRNQHGFAVYPQAHSSGGAK